MKTRRVVFNFHLYLGLAAGLFLVMSGLTGSMIVFRDEIEALIYPELMEVAVRDERVPVQMVLNAVKQAYPRDKLLSVRMPRTPQQTYLLKMNDAHGLFVYADPYSGELLGAHRQEDTLIGWIALLHTELLIGERGKNILGVSALLLICMSITGFVLWWPPNGIKNISRGFKISWAAPWKKLIFDMHRALGIYALLFLVIIAFTGVSLVFNKTVAEFTNFVTASPPRPAPPLSDTSGVAGATLSLDEFLNRADHILPAPTTWINFPQTPQAPLVVRKKMPEESHPNGRSFIYFDQYTSEVLLIENASQAPSGTRIFNTFYPIHIGIIGGLPTRILQVVAGVSPLVLFATGYIMWRNRRKTKSIKNTSIKWARNSASRHDK
ncbi:PepSY domain-containing protein [Nitrosospira lacus]|uniref:PepSY domain-containing protein n=1 Tax=Nitrosospira lacus TaxID=1288494 RepID=A0A1W6SNQ8_9PROT|nr:PepSY-associated TM helix domain-containing protein [Nitrosospira lacus]ARO87450.1 PepSY domain-containing protein [Nitrosospira lacus]